MDTWKILRIIEQITSQSGRVTLGTLPDLARGLGGGNFAVTAGGGKGKKRQMQTDEKGVVDFDEVGGKVELGKDDIEVLLIHLMLLGFLEECRFCVDQRMSS